MVDEKGFMRVLFAICYDEQGIMYNMDKTLTPEQLMLLESALRHGIEDVHEMIEDKLVQGEQQ